MLVAITIILFLWFVATVAQAVLWVVVAALIAIFLVASFGLLR